MKNKIFLCFLAIAIVLIIAAGCKHITKAPDLPASSEAFTVTVGIEKYTVENEVIEDPVLPPTSRGPGDVTVAVNYLNAVADCSGGVLRIVAAMKGQKLTTFQVWINIVPVLITEIKGIVTSGKLLKNFTEMYSATQGLTIQERAAVAQSFAARFSIPLPEAEELTELLVESAVVNMKVAGKIQLLTKKNK